MSGKCDSCLLEQVACDSIVAARNEEKNACCTECSHPRLPTPRPPEPEGGLLSERIASAASAQRKRDDEHGAGRFVSVTKLVTYLLDDWSEQVRALESQIAALREESERQSLRSNDTVEYAIKLQRIIESLCDGRPFSAESEGLHHRAMAERLRARIAEMESRVAEEGR